MFCAIAKRYKQITLCGIVYKFSDEFFRHQIKNYAEISKTNNLRTYTLLMKSVLNPNEEDLSDACIIERFETLFD